jgi:ATP-dependent DNA ligase
LPCEQADDPTGQRRHEQNSPSATDEAREWFEVLPDAIGVEGLVVKGAATRYTPGRRDAWIKVNSVGVAVFDELPSGTYDQVSNGSPGA